MIKVEHHQLLHESDNGFVKINTADIRAAEIYEFEGSRHLLIRLNSGTQLQILPNYDSCILMDYCVANGYQYCLPIPNDIDKAQLLNSLK